MASNNNKRLQELGDSNYEIVDGQPDIRGWDVKDANGKKLGEVDELIFDVQARKIRYIVLDMEDNEVDLEEREILIPIGLAELHENNDDVILRNITIEQLRALPEYRDDTLDTNFEAAIYNVFSGTAMIDSAHSSATNTDTDLYSNEHFNNNLYRNRSSTTSAEDYIRMRQEPSYLEREGTNRMEIDDDIDEMQEDRIEMEERDAIPITNSPEIRAGNDIDERDVTDDNTASRTDTELERDERNNNNGPYNRPTDL